VADREHPGLVLRNPTEAGGAGNQSRRVVQGEAASYGTPSGVAHPDNDLGPQKANERQQVLLGAGIHPARQNGRIHRPFFDAQDGLTTSGSKSNSAQLLILPGLRSTQMRQPLRAAISVSNSVMSGQYLDPLSQTAQRTVSKAELLEVSQCILEIIAARSAAAGGIEDHARRLVEQQSAGVIRAAAERGKRNRLPCAVCGLHPQQPRCVNQSAAHLAMPYTIECLYRRSKHCAAA
jgi:hypothetical protein